MSDKRKMSEHWRIVSLVNEDEIKIFLKNFCNWEFIAERKDIKGGGIDGIFKYYNPFSYAVKKYENILIESKHIEGKYLNSTDLEDQISKLKYQIINFRDKSNKIPQVYDSVEELEGPLTKGIIVHRFEDFSKSKFENSIKKLNIRKMIRYNPPTVYLLNNYQIARFKELYIQCKKPSFYWFYPSNEGNRSDGFYKNPIPSYLFSEFGFLLLNDNFDRDFFHYDDIIGRKKMIFYTYNEPIMRVCVYVKSIFDSLNINSNDINEYFFFEGDHNEIKTYLDNLNRVEINLTKEQLNIIKVDDKKIINFEVLFKK